MVLSELRQLWLGVSFAICAEKSLPLRSKDGDGVVDKRGGAVVTRSKQEQVVVSTSWSIRECRHGSASLRRINLNAAFEGGR